MTVPTARYKFHGPESGPGAEDLIQAIANTIIEDFARGIIAGDDTIFFADSSMRS